MIYDIYAILGNNNRIRVYNNIIKIDFFGSFLDGKIFYLVLFLKRNVIFFLHFKLY